MDRVKDIAREAGPGCRRVLEQDGGDRLIAIAPSPADVALA
jgi:hypothetical protein